MASTPSTEPTKLSLLVTKLTAVSAALVNMSRYGTDRAESPLLKLGWIFCMIEARSNNFLARRIGCEPGGGNLSNDFNSIGFISSRMELGVEKRRCSIPEKSLDSDMMISRSC